MSAELQINFIQMSLKGPLLTPKPPPPPPPRCTRFRRWVLNICETKTILFDALGMYLYVTPPQIRCIRYSTHICIPAYMYTYIWTYIHICFYVIRRPPGIYMDIGYILFDTHQTQATCKCICVYETCTPTQLRRHANAPCLIHTMSHTCLIHTHCVWSRVWRMSCRALHSAECRGLRTGVCVWHDPFRCYVTRTARSASSAAAECRGRRLISLRDMTHSYLCHIFLHMYSYIHTHTHTYTHAHTHTRTQHGVHPVLQPSRKNEDPFLTLDIQCAMCGCVTWLIHMFVLHTQHGVHPVLQPSAEDEDSFLTLEIQRNVWGATDAEILMTTKDDGEKASCAVCLDEMKVFFSPSVFLFC